MIILSLVAVLASCSSKKEYMVRMFTTAGVVDMKLYDETPKHRDNFVKLVKEQAYDSLLFHRVIKDFMIQGGDPDSKNAAAGKLLGEGDLGYTVEPEIMPEVYFHRRGALAAAREGDDVNPSKSSSASQFYIVWGNVFTKEQLERLKTHYKQRTGKDITISYFISSIFIIRTSLNGRSFLSHLTFCIASTTSRPFTTSPKTV